MGSRSLELRVFAVKARFHGPRICNRNLGNNNDDLHEKQQEFHSNSKGAFTARWNSLFILFKFQYLTKHGTLVLVYGIVEFSFF